MQTRNKPKYTELSSAKISDTRNVVISSCSEGGVTIAQQLETQEEGGRPMTVFLKGAFHVKHDEGLYELKDALAQAIRIIEERESEIPWDDDDRQLI